MTSRIQRCYEAVLDTVGKEETERLGAVDLRDVRRFTVAVRGSEPAPQEAVHPLFLSSVLGWGAGPAADRLRPDGLGPDDTRGLPVDQLRLMGAGQELTVHRSPSPGTRVVVHTAVADVRYRDGRSGELLIVRVRRRFTDDAGVDLMTCHETFVGR